MTCDRVRQQLTAYLDGELDADHGTVVRGHLRTCDACRQIATDEAALRDGLRALPSLDPPSHLWAGVQARLAEEEVAESRRPAWRRALARWGRFVPSAPRLVAGGLVAAAAVTLVWWKTQRSAAPDDALVVAPTIELPSPVIAPSKELATIVPPPARDVSDDLARDAARVADDYQRTIDELLAVAADMRSGWSADRKVAFDDKVKTMRAAIAAAPEGKPRQRASRALIRYLDGAVIRDEVLLAGGPR